MTKSELIFSVMHTVRGQAATQDSAKFVHPQVVAKEIAKAYETAVIEFYNTPGASEEYDLSYFSKTYNETVKGTPNNLYVDLSASPIQLPGGNGIRMVKPKNSNVVVTRITESEFTGLRHLEAFCCSPTPFCYPDISAKKIVLQINRPEYNLLEELEVNS